MKNADKTIDVLDRRMTHEMPFIRDDGTMTVKEYFEELEYYGKHIDDYHKGTYKPLWQQRLEA